MIIKQLSLLTSIVLIFSINLFAQAQPSDDYLSWNQKSAVSIGESWREKGRVGGYFDTRVLDTNKSYNYKLRATLMSPQAIRAAARLEQLRSRLTDDETRKLVSDAEKHDLVVIVEIDPREGSGVIPDDWRGFIRSKDSTNDAIRGTKQVKLKEYKALQSVNKRDYDYEIFWMSFSLKDQKGKPLWKSVPAELELIVGVGEKEGKVSWKVSNDLKMRLEKILNIN